MLFPGVIKSLLFTVAVVLTAASIRAHDIAGKPGILRSLTASNLQKLNSECFHYAVVLRDANCSSRVCQFMKTFFAQYAKQAAMHNFHRAFFYTLECDAPGGGNSDGFAEEPLIREICSALPTHEVEVVVREAFDGSWNRYEGEKSPKGLIKSVQKSTEIAKRGPKPSKRGVAEHNIDWEEVDAMAATSIQQLERLFRNTKHFEYPKSSGHSDEIDLASVQSFLNAATIARWYFSRGSTKKTQESSVQSLLHAATIARWYFSRGSTKKAQEFLELALQMANLNALDEERRASINTIFLKLEDMYNALNRAEGDVPVCSSNGDGACNIEDNAMGGRKKIDWTDSIFLRAGWYNDPVVLESHKLLFFTMPENSFTEFSRLFRRMMGYNDWDAHGINVHDPEINGLRYLGHYTREKQEEFLTSKDWTRAIFLRDPLQRLVSAYEDKALAVSDSNQTKVPGWYIKERCCGMGQHAPHGDPARTHCAPVRPYELPATEDVIPFSYFVEHFLERCPDWHWRPQSSRMSRASWQFVNFVGNFDNVKEDAHSLLTKIGAFDEYGSHGWGGNNGTFLERNFANHSKSSNTRQRDFSPSLKRKALCHYADDYEHPVMNFTKPEPSTSKGIPTYWINLDSRVDRSLAMESSLQKVQCDIDAHRVSAIDCVAAARVIEAAGMTPKEATGSNSTSLCSRGVTEIGSMFSFRGKGTGDPVRVVELAVTMSHVSAIWKAYSNGDAYALIIEDDVMLDASHTDRFRPQELRSLVAGLGEELPFMTQLYCNNPTSRIREIVAHPPRTVIGSKSFCHGLQQYILNRPCMHSILTRYVPDLLDLPTETTVQALQDAFTDTLTRNEVEWIAEPALYTICPFFLSSRPYGFQLDGISDVQVHENGEKMQTESPERVFEYFYSYKSNRDIEAPSTNLRWNVLQDDKVHPYVS